MSLCLHLSWRRTRERTTEADPWRDTPSRRCDGGLNHPIANRGNAERSLASAVRFRDHHPPHRGGPVCLQDQFLAQARQPRLQAPLLDLRKTHSIHTRGRPHSSEAKPLVSFQINRQFSGWNAPPKVFRAFGAHGQELTFSVSKRSRHSHLFQTSFLVL
jgi:hypothetical protein